MLYRSGQWLGWLLAAAAALPVAAVAAYLLRERIPQHWQTPLRAWVAGVSVHDDVRIAMDDGVELASTLYFPRGPRRHLATVYIALPYDRTRYPESLGAALFFARHGYAVLLQDVRGKFGSGGRFLPWRRATADGAATLDWIVRQPWSNGKVGTWGCSALGELQYALARARHPAHAAMIPLAAGGAVGSAAGSYEYFGVFEGGVFQLASAVGWFVRNGAEDPAAPPPGSFDTAALLRQLPVASLVERVRPGANTYARFLDTPLDDPAWAQRDFIAPGDPLATPALVINSWGDQTINGTLRLAEIARSRGVPQHVILAPGGHCLHDQLGDPERYGELSLENTAQPYWEWYLAWFDHWLRGQGDGLASLPPYLYYVNGEQRWRQASAWPPERSRPVRWYLESAGKANSRRGDGELLDRPPVREHVDAYRHDPMDPVPSRGGSMCCTGDRRILAGAQDQREVEMRQDVLVYTTAPLKQAVLIAGPLHARLYVSSSAPDTDFIARLVHVDPEGRALNIQEGALRARYREGFRTPVFMRPGQVYELDIDMRSIAYRVPAGHRLRLDIASSSFPRLERNLNTGGDNARETVGQVATNRVHHGPQHASYVELRVLPTG